MEFSHVGWLSRSSLDMSLTEIACMWGKRLNVPPGREDAAELVIGRRLLCPLYQSVVSTKGWSARSIPLSRFMTHVGTDRDEKEKERRAAMMRRMQKRVLDQEGVVAFFVIKEEFPSSYDGPRTIYEPFSKTLYTYVRDRPMEVGIDLLGGDGAGETLFGLFHDDMTPVVLPIQKPSPRRGYWLEIQYPYPSSTEQPITHIHYPTFDMLTKAGERIRFDNSRRDLHGHIDLAKVVCMRVATGERLRFAETRHLTGSASRIREEEEQVIVARCAFRALLGNN